jgi:hypothetical protein
MKKLILAIITLSFIGVSCSKQQELVTSPITKTTPVKKTRTLTGGNGNGTEFNREYEVIERNGTIKCIEPGDDCRVGSVSASQASQIDIFRNYLKNGTITTYFQTGNWQILFPNLVNESKILEGLRNGSLHMFEKPNFTDNVCFVLTNSSTYNPTSIIKVWNYTNNNTTLHMMLSNYFKDTREQKILDPGDKVDCTKQGDNCDVGEKTDALESQQLNLLDNYILSDNVRGYFNNERWTILFPLIDNETLVKIKNGNLNIYKINYVTNDARSYILTSAQSNNSLNNVNTLHSWVFPN